MNPLSVREHRTYAALAVVVVAVYVVLGWLWLQPAGPAMTYRSSPRPLFGLDQLHHLGRWGIVAWLAATATLAAAYPSLATLAARLPTPGRRVRRALVGGVAVVFAGLCYLLRSRALNPDGRALTEVLARAVGAHTHHLTHDEMLELFVHGRFWWWTHESFGWSVATSYQVLAALAGGVFVVLLWSLCRLLAPRAGAALTVAVLCGGSVQLFFGDVENYSLTAVWVLAYLYTAVLHLQRRGSLALPALLLGVAIAFHLLALLMLPSLLYLIFRSARRRRWTAVAVAAAAPALVVGLTLLLLQQLGVPLAGLWTGSHASGHGGDYLSALALGTPAYYLAQFNLLALLAPGIWLVPALAIHRRWPLRPEAILLALAGGGLLLLQLLWDAKLGVYNDWNLYACGAIPVQLLVWSQVFRADIGGPQGRLWVVACSLAGTHTACWLVANHLFEG